MLIDIPEQLITKLQKLSTFTVVKKESDRQKSWGDCSVYYDCYLVANSEYSYGGSSIEKYLYDLQDAANLFLTIIKDIAIPNYNI